MIEGFNLAWNTPIFVSLFTVLSLGAFFMPFWWGVVESFAAVFVSWWVVYRSGLF